MLTMDFADDRDINLYRDIEQTQQRLINRQAHLQIFLHDIVAVLC
jgi:hypothetical protein